MGGKEGHQKAAWGAKVPCFLARAHVTLKCQGWKGPWRVSGFLGSHTDLVAELGLESRSPDSQSKITLSLLTCARADKCVCVRIRRLWVHISSWAKWLYLQAEPVEASAFPSMKWVGGKMKGNSRGCK